LPGSEVTKTGERARPHRRPANVCSSAGSASVLAGQTSETNDIVPFGLPH